MTILCGSGNGQWSKLACWTNTKCTTFLYRLSSSFMVLNTGLGNNYRHSICLAVLKTELPNINRISTSFTVVKTALLDLYKHSTGFAVVKIYLANTYKPSKCVWWSSTGIQHTSRLACITGSQQRHDNPLQAFNYLASRSNLTGEYLHAWVSTSFGYSKLACRTTTGL